MSDKLELLKSKLEISDYSKDFVLEQYLDDAESFLLSETNRTQLNDALKRIVVDVAYHAQLESPSAMSQGKYVYFEESFEDVFILNKRVDAIQIIVKDPS